MHFLRDDERAKQERFTIALKAGMTHHALEKPCLGGSYGRRKHHFKVVATDRNIKLYHWVFYFTSALPTCIQTESS